MRRRAVRWGVAGTAAAAITVVFWGAQSGHLPFEAVAGQLDAAFGARTDG